MLGTVLGARQELGVELWAHQRATHVQRERPVRYLELQAQINVLLVLLVHMLDLNRPHVCSVHLAHFPGLLNRHHVLPAPLARMRVDLDCLRARRVKQAHTIWLPARNFQWS